MNDPAIEEIEVVLDEAGISLSRADRARVGQVLDRVRAGEIGPTCDANDDRMRDYREQAFVQLAATLRADAGIVSPAPSESADATCDQECDGK